MYSKVFEVGSSTRKPTFQLFLLFSILTGVLSSAMWDQTSVTVKQGDMVELTCTVTNVGYANIVRVEQNDTHGVLSTVTDASDVKTPYKFLPRYSVLYSYHSHVGTLSISYKGIRGEDGGTLLCRKLPEDRDVARAVINVQVPVKLVTLVSILPDGSGRPVQPNEDIRLRETLEGGITCVAVIEGSLAINKIRLTVDDTDVTHLFRPNITSRVIPAPGGVRVFYAEYKLTYWSVKPDFRFNDRVLTCRALQQGFDEVTASAAVRVEYIPVILCPRYEYHVKSGGEVKVTCEVSSNPGSMISWSLLDEQGKVKEIGEDDHDFKIINRVVDDDTTRTTLHLASAAANHFTQYYLAAANDIDRHEVTIQLQRIPDKDEFVKSSYPEIPEEYSHLIPPEMKKRLHNIEKRLASNICELEEQRNSLTSIASTVYRTGSQLLYMLLFILSSLVGCNC